MGNDKISEEKIERIYEMLDEGKKNNEIAEELDVHRNTVSKYKEEWREDRELDMKVHQEEFDIDQFEMELKKVPRIGDKKIDFAMSIVEINPEIIKSPDAVFKLLVKDIGVKKTIADTFCRGLINRYSIGQEIEEESVPYYGGQPRYTEDQARGLNQQERLGGRYRSQIKQNTQPPQQQMSTQQGMREEKMISIEVPMMDDEGNPQRDEDGDVVYMRKTVPESKAEHLGFQENKGSDDTLINGLIKLQKAGLIPDNQGQGAEPEESKLMSKIDKLNREVRKLKSGKSKSKRRRERDERVSKQEVTELVKEDRQELLKQMERQQKDKELEELKERFDRMLEEREEHELSKVPEDVRERKLDMQQQKNTSETIIEGIDTITDKLDDMMERAMTFGEGQSSEKKQVELYQNLVNNLMAQGQSKEKAIKTARYLLYGQSPKPTKRPPSEQQQTGQQTGAEEDPLVKDLKERAKAGDI